MNMFKAFEARIAKAFGASPQGATAPFSFRRLGRRAAREMEMETYVVDGVNTAPALITILVSQEDNALMRPLYETLATEIANLVEAEAAHKGYVFVGKPLARFMVDPSLRRGRFAVFANNVDALTLEKLREEEHAFLSGFGAFGGAASSGSDVVIPLEEQAVDQLDGLPVVERAVSEDSSAGLSVLPADYVDASLDLREAGVQDPAEPELLSLADALPEVMPVPEPIAAHRSMPVPEVVATPAPEPVAAHMAAAVGSRVPAVPATSAAPAAVVDPASMPRPVSQDSTITPPPVPVVEDDPATCLLIDRQSGRTYIGTAPETAIGREHTPGSIVLHDPNVSRRHAKLTYDGRVWRIHDLGSTNGTLVNDVDVDSCVLRDGDLITLGLLNLEFKES